MTSPYEKEVRSLLRTLSRHGVEPAYVIDEMDGERCSPTIPTIMACDECRLVVKRGDARTWLYLIFGNSPGEVVADYGIPKDGEFNHSLDMAVNEHYERWAR